MNKLLCEEYNDWNIIYKIIFPLAYIRYLGIVLSEKKKQEDEKMQKLGLGEE